MATVKKASSEVAHWSPSFRYICTPKSGNAAVTGFVSALIRRLVVLIGVRVNRKETLKLTAEAASCKTISRQCACSVERIGVYEESEDATED